MAMRDCSNKVDLMKTENVLYILQLILKNKRNLLPNDSRNTHEVKKLFVPLNESMS
ncbi:hypothetical protein [Bacillus thuringiensis]|uniref:hypothetical protein n=1 Tax=Bacillus thuringiensis TaxID=1428 RepID=UPI0015C51B85|nr:hypothetical protein [Bacillus thuringiensis]